MTARELARHFEVSSRTILRDVDILAASGIPLYTAQGKNGGISIMEHFVLHKSVMSEAEQEQVLLALKSLGAVNHMEADVTLRKLKHFFNKTDMDMDWIDIDPSSWGSPPSGRQQFDALRRAVVARNVIEIEYLNAYGQRRRRVLEPLRLVFKAHSWYLQAFCRAKQDHRIYKISRMRDLQVREERFARRLPPDVPFDSVRQAETVPMRICLRFAPEAAYRVHDEFSDEKITVEADGYHCREIYLNMTNCCHDWCGMLNTKGQLSI